MLSTLQYKYKYCTCKYRYNVHIYMYACTCTDYAHVHTYSYVHGQQRSKYTVLSSPGIAGTGILEVEGKGRVEMSTAGK